MEPKNQSEVSVFMRPTKEKVSKQRRGPSMKGNCFQGEDKLHLVQQALNPKLYTPKTLNPKRPPTKYKVLARELRIRDLRSMIRCDTHALPWLGDQSIETAWDPKPYTLGSFSTKSVM